MANLIYQNRETTLFFVPAAAAQAETKIFELDSLAAGTGIQAAIHDLGEGARAGWYEWRAFVQFATIPVLDENVAFAIKTAGSSLATTTHPDNDDGTTAGAISSVEKFESLHQIGSIVVNEAAADVEMVASGLLWIASRSIQIAAWNYSADALTTDVDENGFFLSPLAWEIQ